MFRNFVDEYGPNYTQKQFLKFLKNYTIPFVQLNPMKSILCFAHDANTFDKSRLLQNPNPTYVKKTKLKLSNFIRNKEMAKFYTEQ